MRAILNLFSALLLAPLAALNLARALPELPSFGILRAGISDGNLRCDGFP